jgi:glycosyltransferase involved in cell wall biosynthesis
VNLLLTADQYFPPTLGGSAISTRRLARGLAERGHQVTVLAPAARFADYVEQEDGVSVIRCRSIPALHLVRNSDRDTIRAALFSGRTAARTVESLRPDMVHVQVPAHLGASAARAASRLGIPLVATLHAVPENLFPSASTRSPLFRFFARNFWARVVAFCNRCDVVTAPTATACRLLRDQAVERPLVAISNGVDLSAFRPPRDDAEREACRTRLGLPIDRPIVLYAGRFAPEKRLDVLVDAIPLVLARAAAHFVFCGFGATAVQGWAEARGVSSATTFLGLLPDELLPLAYRAADLLAQPSEAELQGIVLLEGAASGLPLVGADALAIPELIVDGHNGFLHRPGDPADLADKIVRLLEGGAQHRGFGERSLAVAREHAFERTLDSFERLYESVRAPSGPIRGARAG